MLFFYVFLFQIKLTYSLFDADKEEELDASNIQDFIKKEQFTLIYFYSPWNVACKENSKVIDSLKVSFKQREDVFIGKIDIYKNRKVASKFRIEDYCTMKYFVKGSKVPESYEGNVTESELSEFIKTSSEVEHDDDIFHRSVIELSSHDFRRVVKDESKVALVFFYTKWCKKCKYLFTTMKAVGRKFKNDVNCVLGQIDGDDHSDITVEFLVPVYPMFKFFSKENKDGVTYLPGKYDENWSEKNITKFLNVHCRKKHQSGGDVVYDKMDGRNSDLDAKAHFYVRNFKKRDEMIRNTVLFIQSLPPYKRAAADYYVEVMRRIKDEGEEFIEHEVHNINKLLLGKVVKKEREEMNRKKNVLEQFIYRRHDEL